MYIGLYVSLNETYATIINKKGDIMQERKLLSDVSIGTSAKVLF